ncbi:MAG TPA: CoA-binding protein, partial [Methanocorpusculum sp.]|nr:CoA-binding protein [Methanocorpusculum sp.]
DESRFRGVFDVLCKNSTLWDIAILVNFPNKVLESDKVAKVLIDYSNKTNNTMVGVFIGGESMNAGISLLNQNQIPVFSELEETFKILSYIG